jgi:hypothetical protein
VRAAASGQSERVAEPLEAWSAVMSLTPYDGLRRGLCQRVSRRLVYKAAYNSGHAKKIDKRVPPGQHGGLMPGPELGECPRVTAADRVTAVMCGPYVAHDGAADRLIRWHPAPTALKGQDHGDIGRSGPPGHHPEE